MKLNGNITILVSGKGATIEIRDKSSRIRFLKIDLSAEQFVSCLGRLPNVECELDLIGLDKVGKNMEVGKHEFKIPDDIYKYRNEDRENTYESFQRLAQSQLTDGWTADFYFGSQNSFFQKDGEQWARVTIRRWV